MMRVIGYAIVTVAVGCSVANVYMLAHGGSAVLWMDLFASVTATIVTAISLSRLP